METQTILCWAKNTAYFLFSTAHFLITRILPLIAMLVGSLLLRLLRLILSSLRLIWALKTVFLKRNPSDSARHGGGADQYALQEKGFDPEELGASAVQNVPDLHRQGHRFEDRFDVDFIDRQRLMLKQFEDMNRTRVTTTTIRERSQAASVEQMLDKRAGELLKQQRLSGDQSLQERHGYLLRSNQGGRPHLRPVPGETSRQSGVRGCSSNRQIGFSAEQVIETNDLAGMEGSQPRALFMSDLPPTLDDVVQAAKADAERSRRRRGDQVPSLAHRSIPPTLSDVQMALQEMRAEENQLHAANAAPAPLSQAQHAMPANDHRSANTASYEHFLTKFAEHFRLDRK